MLKRQTEIPHSRGKVGVCHFCQHDSAELWFDPSDDWKPFQVRCHCGASGPWADCGWESAVPAWDMVGRKTGFAPTYRGPDAEEPTPLPENQSQNTGGRS